MDTPPVGERAAYSASQPLYDALRTVVTRVDRSRNMLEAAMNQVRNGHVKAESDRARYGSTAQEEYVDLSVNAWRGITDAFTTVFAELSNLTESKLHEGRSERPGHKLISTLYQTTLAAKTAAHAFPVIGDHIPNRQSQSFGWDSKATTTSLAGKRVRSTEDLQYAQVRASKVRCVERESASTDRNPGIQLQHPKTWDQQPAIVQEKLETLDLSHAPIKHDLPQSYEVKYEDVSAEVEARLQAKAAKRTEKKGAMKRKRNSRQSLNLDESQAQEQLKGPRKKARKRKSDVSDNKDDARPQHGVKRDADRQPGSPAKKRRLDA